jgi:hypothetical protein
MDCRTEEGWFAILDKEPEKRTGGCDWEHNNVTNSYPMILFSTKKATPMDRFGR